MSGVDEIFCCCDTAETGDLEAMLLLGLGRDEKGAGKSRDRRGWKCSDCKLSVPGVAVYSGQRICELFFDARKQELRLW